jgi:pyridoxal phosphate enzyme (YggS family)
MSPLSERLAALRGRIDAACRDTGRDPAEVLLLAVSKTFPAEAVREAYDAGQRCFGESRQQEAAPKISALPADIEWHFIGGLQRNKARKVVAAFPVIHSVDSLRLAAAIDRVAEEEGKCPRIYLEVNIAGEASKGGFAPGELLAAAEELAALKQVRLEGLMTLPPDDLPAARQWFSRTRELRDRLRESSGLALPGLSMGMSADFEGAVREGSTIVRVGSALFGHRSYPA